MAHGHRLRWRLDGVLMTLLDCVPQSAIKTAIDSDCFLIAT